MYLHNLVFHSSAPQFTWLEFRKAADIPLAFGGKNMYIRGVTTPEALLSLTDIKSHVRRGSTGIRETDRHMGN